MNADELIELGGVRRDDGSIVFYREGLPTRIVKDEKSWYLESAGVRVPISIESSHELRRFLIAVKLSPPATYPNDLTPMEMLSRAMIEGDEQAAHEWVRKYFADSSIVQRTRE